MKKRLFVASIIATLSLAAHAQMVHLLVAQWYENGSQFCKYDNGTVLNMGINLCPLSIKG